jgi:site-specific recombinase XerD
MIDQFYSRPSSSDHLRLGPLGTNIDVFAKHLEERGFARWTVQEKIWVVAGFSRWLQSEKRGVENLDEQVVSEFLRYRRRKGLSRHGAAPALRDLLRAGFITPILGFWHE